MYGPATGVYAAITTVRMTDAPGIKSEDSDKAVNSELGIKADPEVSKIIEGSMLDEDIYEDAGDLDFTYAARAIYLTRIPKFLWKTWSQMEDDQEIRLGTIRIEGSIEKPKRMSLMLSSDAPANETLPKEYNMQITNQASANTFVFTEKDFPGYSNKLKVQVRRGPEGAAQPFSQAVPRIHLLDRPRPGNFRVDKGRRPHSYHRKAVPKMTAFAGQVQTEINCLPVENEEYRRIMDERARQEQKPKRETQFLRGSVHGGNVLNPGTLGKSGNFNTFIKTSAQPRQKGQELKASRIPQNELLDLIYECFTRYTYWPLKSLKAELNQPEAYLRQTLEMVGQLVRQGPHAMTWQLKPESKLAAYADSQSFDQAKDGQAPEAAAGFDGASDLGEGIGTDEDDDNVKMEDVRPI